MRRPATEAQAYRRLERVRWGGSPPACPHCGVGGRCYYLRPVDDAGRRTRTGARSPRRVWKCGACRRQFSVLTGTVFEGTRIPLRAWLAALAGQAPDLSAEGARHVSRRLAAALEAVPSGGDDLLAAVLRLPAETAASIRTRTPGRLRARRQDGPSADYG